MRSPNCSHPNVVIQLKAVGKTFPSISGGTLCDPHLASPCRLSSLPCQLSCCAAARHSRNPHQIPRYPPSRSKRRRQEQPLCRRKVQRPRPPTTATIGHRNHRPRKIRSSRPTRFWEKLRGWRNPPPVVTVAAKSVIGSATPPGLDAVRVANAISALSRQRAGTR